MSGEGVGGGRRIGKGQMREEEERGEGRSPGVKLIEGLVLDSKGGEHLLGQPGSQILILIAGGVLCFYPVITLSFLLLFHQD